MKMQQNICTDTNFGGWIDAFASYNKIGAELWIWIVLLYNSLVYYYQG